MKNEIRARPCRCAAGLPNRSKHFHLMKTQVLLPTILALALGAGTALAATRTSANYTVSTETVDAAGGRAGSAAYLHDGCLGGLGGLSTVAAPPQVAKHGYLGQLYDVSALALSASPPTVDERAVRPITASAVLDDATFQRVFGTEVAWTIVSGPIQSISPAGQALADTVYQNTPATIAGLYQNRSATLDLTVLNVDNDDFGLYGGDGIDDAWQVNYFGLDNPLAFPGADPDLDGQTNRFEYIAGTIPTDYESRFRLRIERVDGRPTHRALIFSPRYPSRSYTVQFRTNVASGLFEPLTGALTNDNGVIRTVTDRTATNAARFYRVRITYP